jgi:uncharacterized protein
VPLVTDRAGGVRIAVHIQPRASRTEVTGVHGNAIKIRVTQAAVDGSANEALIKFVAERLALPVRSVRIVSGARSRAKIIEADGVSVDAVHRLLATPG